MRLLLIIFIGILYCSQNLTADLTNKKQLSLSDLANLSEQKKYSNSLKLRLPTIKKKIKKEEEKPLRETGQIKKTSFQKRVIKKELPKLSKNKFFINSRKELILNEYPNLNSRYKNKILEYGKNNEQIFYSLIPNLVDYGATTLKNASVDVAAIVLIDNTTGKIISMNSKSKNKNSILHSYFPAASIFKIISSAAVLEKAKIPTNKKIYFRGGNYTLNSNNYLANKALDKRSFNFDTALAKSINPVFSRLSLKHLNNKDLAEYAYKFGFNRDLKFDIPINESSASLKSNTKLNFARLSAGFGNVNLNPIHAAAIMSSLSNNGRFAHISLVDKIVTQENKTIYKHQKKSLFPFIKSETSKTLLKMLSKTTETGTAAKAFKNWKHGIKISSKTGTLTGKNPEGLTRWFIASAPAENPKVSLAVVTVKARNTSSKATSIGYKILNNYFNNY